MIDVLPRLDQRDAADRGLLARCVEGDLPAMHGLFERHRDTVWGCSTVVARRPGAPAPEDLVAEAFIGLWHHARAILASSRSVEASLVVAVARLAAGRPGFD